jgi:hypothetical protein
MPKYSPIPGLSPRESEEDAADSLLGAKTAIEKERWRPTLRGSLLTTAGLVAYSLAICWVTKLAVLGSYPHQLSAPASSCKFKSFCMSNKDTDKLTVLKSRIQMKRNTSSLRLANMGILGLVTSSTANQVPKLTRPGLIYSSVCATLEAAPTSMNRRVNTSNAAFNTRVPAERYEATMNNRSSVRVADGSENPDYYVTLTVYHELHCLVSCPVLVPSPFSSFLIRGFCR